MTLTLFSRKFIKFIIHSKEYGLPTGSMKRLLLADENQLESGTAMPRLVPCANQTKTPNLYHNYSSYQEYRYGSGVSAKLLDIYPRQSTMLIDAVTPPGTYVSLSPMCRNCVVAFRKSMITLPSTTNHRSVKAYYITVLTSIINSHKFNRHHCNCSNHLVTASYNKTNARNVIFEYIITHCDRHLYKYTRWHRHCL